MLSVNIDHVATLRQARYRQSSAYGEPDVVLAVREVELAGAQGVTMHLREDRRHVIDSDVDRARALAKVHFNFEMAATDEMVAIAGRIKPHSAMLVPEGRHEVTTEGGLDVAGQVDRLRGVVARLKHAGCLVSAFLDAEERQIDAAQRCDFDICEVHTGPYAEAFASAVGNMQDARLADELAKVRKAGVAIMARGMRFNAGHALGYANVGAIAVLPGVQELHIGHAIVSRAVFVGLREATHEMLRAMARGITTS